MRTIDDVLGAIPSPAGQSPIPAPPYNGMGCKGLALAVEDMRRHMTDEGWQVMAGLEYAGYRLAGHALGDGETDVPQILKGSSAGVVVVQDKREWDVNPKDFREVKARFTNMDVLARRPDLFTLTILKDCHQNPPYHRESAEEIGCNAWVVYYHPRIVKHVAPYVRPEHLIRVYHTLDSDILPHYSAARSKGCLVSGASMAKVYPLRNRLVRESRWLKDTDVLKHPGYHRSGSATPGFLKTLSQYRVAICTSSVYGYALRKIIEATAAGCAVITDLPADEVLPHIDGNLTRVDPTATADEINDITSRLIRDYDPRVQEEYARKCRVWYDYRAAGTRLAQDIEQMRRGYNNDH